MLDHSCWEPFSCYRWFMGGWAWTSWRVKNSQGFIPREGFPHFHEFYLQNPPPDSYCEEWTKSPWGFWWGGKGESNRFEITLGFVLFLVCGRKASPLVKLLYNKYKALPDLWNDKKLFWSSLYQKPKIIHKTKNGDSNTWLACFPSPILCTTSPNNRAPG